MKNKEKYVKEIVELACDVNGIAVDKHSGTVCSCNYVPCSNCLFDDSKDCIKRRKDWAESEYIENPVISKRDRAFLECIREEYKFIARDMSGNLYIYARKPYKQIDCWDSSEHEMQEALCMLNVDFPMVKWSDSEPWLIEDLKKLEVVEEYE